MERETDKKKPLNRHTSPGQLTRGWKGYNQKNIIITPVISGTNRQLRNADSIRVGPTGLTKEPDWRRVVGQWSVRTIFAIQMKYEFINRGYVGSSKIPLHVTCCFWLILSVPGTIKTNISRTSHCSHLPGTLLESSSAIHWRIPVSRTGNPASRSYPQEVAHPNGGPQGSLISTVFRYLISLNVNQSINMKPI